MKLSRTRYLTLAVAVAVAVSATAFGQGADVIVGDLNGISSYGASGGISAYSIGTTSCNVGTVPLLWIASTPQHPVIGQNIYRIKDGVFEQIGISWLKHGFTALQGTVCSPCNANPNGSALGVGCSDPYGSGLNGNQGGLGPRYQVNPTTGVFPYPFANPSYSGSIARRIQVPTNDILPAMNPGAVYLGEGHYIAADDAQAGNGFNNASYRLLSFDSSGNASTAGPTVRELPAIMGWPAIDPSAQVVTADNAGERFIVGFNTAPAAGGFTKYIYAVHNLNSDRAAGGFSVSLPNGASVQNLTFHGTASHSGSLWADATPWASAVLSNGVSWATQSPFNSNPNGRAIRWGQCFTFTFESNLQPGAVTIDYFKPGSPSSLTVSPFTIPTPEWQVNSAAASMDINGNSNDPFTGAIQTTVPFGSLNTLNYGSTVAGAPYDIIYQPGDAVSVNNGGILYWPGYLLNVNLFDPLRPWALVFNGFTANMPPAGLSIPFSAPPVALSLCAQLALIDAGSPIGVSFSAANDFDVVSCSGATINHSLGDDNSTTVTLGSGGDHECVAGASFYGTVYNSVDINSNGSLSFTAGSGDFTPTVSEFTSQMPRFAGMWTDLSPNVSGTITSTSTPGVLTVSFAAVPEYGTAVTSSFDMVLDTLSGVVSLTNYAPGAAHATATLVGVSPGGGAASNSVTYGSMGIGGSMSFGANRAIYQLVGGGAPTGFTHLDFITSGGSTSVTRVN